MRTTLKVSVGVILLLLGTSLASAVPVEGTLNAGASASTSATHETPATDFNTTTWISTPTELSVQATATATDDGGNSAVAFAKHHATWAADGNSGTFASEIGWISNGAARVDSMSGRDWVYTFQADQDSLFVLDYSLAGSWTSSYAEAGLNGYMLLKRDATNTLLDWVDLSFTSNPSTGQYQSLLVGGTTYTFTIFNQANLDAGATAVLPPGETKLTSAFSWSITNREASVPEAASTATLLALGGLLLAFARARRTA